MTARKSLKRLYECIDYHNEDLLQLLLNQQSYDNRIDPEKWATDAMIPTAQMFTMVEEQLGPAMDGLCPDTNGLQLVPRDNDVTPQQWQTAEWALWTQLKYAMKLRDVSLRSIKDSIKVGLGYGIVEPFSYIPDERANLVGDGKSKPIMIAGDAKTAIRYRYISVGKIIPETKGSDFDGPDATPGFWFYDPYPAWDLKAMYDGTLPDGISKDQLQSTYEKVEIAAKKYARTSCRFKRMADLFGGRKEEHRTQDDGEYELNEIPIIKHFEQPNKWTWIVPDGSGDGEIIYESENVGQQISSGMIKWSSYPDGDRWYPMNIAEACRMQGYAHDIWFNFLIDQMGRANESVRVINKSALSHGDRELADGEDIFINGTVRDAVGYVTVPNIDPQLMGLGGIIDGVGDKIKGNADLTSKNYTRGGNGAFNKLMNSTQGRQHLSIAILETGGLTKVYERVLSYMQVLVPDDGYDMVRPVYDDATDGRILDARNITGEDLNHNFALELDISTRRLLGDMDVDTRLRLWEAGKNNKDMRPSEHNRLFPVPESFAHRLFKAKKEQERLQREDRDIEMINAMSQGQNAMPQGEAGMAGQGAGQGLGPQDGSGAGLGAGAGGELAI